MGSDRNSVRGHDGHHASSGPTHGTGCECDANRRRTNKPLVCTYAATFLRAAAAGLMAIASWPTLLGSATKSSKVLGGTPAIAGGGCDLLRISRARSVAANQTAPQGLSSGVHCGTACNTHHHRLHLAPATSNSRSCTQTCDSASSASFGTQQSLQTRTSTQESHAIACNNV